MKPVGLNHLKVLVLTFSRLEFNEKLGFRVQSASIAVKFHSHRKSLALDSVTELDEFTRAYSQLASIRCVLILSSDTSE
jgi:hypothetical protein